MSNTIRPGDTAHGSASAAMPAGAELSHAGVRVSITYYTDPLCSWSWAMEPHWRRLCEEYGQYLTWRYRMGGMIADWQNYQDPLNAVSRPFQMGPQWFQVRHTTGVAIDERIWHDDPPASSYPACLAVKAAEQQGAMVGEAYLGRLRRAVMLERRNIARREILLAIAEEMSRAAPGEISLDHHQFERDLGNQAVLAAFREDLVEASYRNIGRFPTLILQGPAGPGIILVGYRPYDILQAALRHVAPDLIPGETAASVTDPPLASG